MDLNFIKETSCPICGCSVIKSESIETDIFDKKKYRQHVCGGRWEHRTFACGQEISYCPNFSKTEINEYSVCTNNEIYKTKIQKRKDFIETMKQHAENYKDVDEEFKKRILYQLNITP